MALENSTQIALALLQTIGLLIPIIFLTFREEVTMRNQGPVELDDEGLRKIDLTPYHIRLAEYITLTLVISAIMAGIAILKAQGGFNLVSISLISLIIGLLGFIFIIRNVRKIYQKVLH